MQKHRRAVKSKPAAPVAGTSVLSLTLSLHTAQIYLMFIDAIRAFHKVLCTPNISFDNFHSSAMPQTQQGPCCPKENTVILAFHRVCILHIFLLTIFIAVSCQRLNRPPVVPRKIPLHLPSTGFCVLHIFHLTTFTAVSCQRLNRAPVAPRKIPLHLPSSGFCALHIFLLTIHSMSLIPNGTCSGDGYALEFCYSHSLTPYYPKYPGLKVCHYFLTPYYPNYPGLQQL